MLLITRTYGMRRGTHARKRKRQENRNAQGERCAAPPPSRTQTHLLVVALLLFFMRRGGGAQAHELGSHAPRWNERWLTCALTHGGRGDNTQMVRSFRLVRKPTGTFALGRSSHLRSPHQLRRDKSCFASPHLPCLCLFIVMPRWTRPCCWGFTIMRARSDALVQSKELSLVEGIMNAELLQRTLTQAIRGSVLRVRERGYGCVHAQSLCILCLSCFFV